MSGVPSIQNSVPYPHSAPGMALRFESPRKRPETPHKTTSFPPYDGPTAPSFISPTVPWPLEERQPEFRPTLRFYLAFVTLAVITMMVALDGTSLSVALPVNSHRYVGILHWLTFTRSLHRSSKAQPLRPSGPEPPFFSAPPSFSPATLLSHTFLVVNQ